MKILKSKRTNNTVSLEIEVSLETLEEGITKAFNSMVKQAKVPGFRAGKVPRNVFEKHYGKEILLKDGITEAVNIAYLKAIQEESLDVVDYPQNLSINEYKENEPLIFTCDVDVKPEIKVDKYKGIKVEKESITISEDVVQTQLQQLQNSAVEYKVVEREVQKEDLLKVNVKATIDNQEFSKWTKENVGVGIGSSIFSEKFDDNLVGKKANEVLSFSVHYDKDYHLKDVADKNVDFKVTITQVKEKHVPEITDALVEKLTQFKTVEELTENIKTSLENQRKNEVDEKLKTDLIDTIVEKTTFDIPESMLKYELEQDKAYFEATLKQSGGTIETYLKMTQQSEEDFNKQLMTNTQKRVKQQLVINAIEKKEEITANEDDIKAEILRMKPEATTDEKIAEERKKINENGLTQMIKQKKVFDFLIEHAKIVEKKV
ncbi:trigger factor [bacterium]|nr:trigger factor [bacterium]|tara:strand:- start:4540 stop:5835 length:1296 start_codon:yes stop_codon:yes gene_type:complete